MVKDFTNGPDDLEFNPSSSHKKESKVPPGLTLKMV